MHADSVSDQTKVWSYITSYVVSDAQVLVSACILHLENPTLAQALVAPNHNFVLDQPRYVS